MGEFSLENWAKNAGLAEATITKLKAETLDLPGILCQRTERELQLPLGQKSGWKLGYVHCAALRARRIPQTNR